MVGPPSFQMLIHSRSSRSLSLVKNRRTKKIEWKSLLSSSFFFWPISFFRLSYFPNHARSQSKQPLLCFSSRAFFGEPHPFSDFLPGPILFLLLLSASPLALLFPPRTNACSAKNKIFLWHFRMRDFSLKNLAWNGVVKIKYFMGKWMENWGEFGFE